MEFAEELSKQLSKELNETIIVYHVEGSWIKCEGTNNMYSMILSNQVSHRYFPTNINKNESLLLINGEKNYKISLFCYSKCDITTIIQMYNETRQYKNSLNKEFNLDCEIASFYDDDNVIDEVIINISEYDLGKYIQPIYAKTYLECHEQINKIITLKNELLSHYGTIEESDGHESLFVLNIDNNEIITLQYTLYRGDDHHEDIRIRITIDTNKLLIYEVYNQFRNYINNFIINYNDDCFHDIYCNISSIYVDMSYTYNKNNIHVEITKEANNIFHITINSEIKNITFKVITEIYDEVIRYIDKNESNIRYINKLFNEVNVIYMSNNVVNIDARITNLPNTYDNIQKSNNICASNYIEFSNKLEIFILEGKKSLEEYILKKKQEKEEEEKRLEKERLNKCEEDIKKMALELSNQLKEDIIIKEFTKNSFIILGANLEYITKINVKYYNIIDVNISKIYNEIRTYRINNDLHKKYQFNLYIETDYTNSYPNKIILKWDDNEISAQNYFELDQKITEFIKISKVKLNEKLALKLKEEQEKFVTNLKLKYGDKTILSKKYNNNYSTNSIIDINLVISNVDIEHIDLLDIIHNYLGNRIVNGFIKEINCANYEKYMNITKDKPIFKITIQNCHNLKIINNIIHFENNAHLKILNCPKLEFIQNYNIFTEIYIDNHRVKVITE